MNADQQPRRLPTISVIMPCYNVARFVSESVASVFGQTYPEVELIVIDDGSDDNTVEILRSLVDKHPGRMKLLSQDHQGPYPARNLGLRNAKGELIAFLDADDLWKEECVESLYIGLMEQNADLAYCGWQNLGVTTHSTKPFIPPKYEEGNMSEEFLRSCPWPIHAALTRRTVIDAVGGFSERYFSSMDYDLWLRILGHTLNMVRVPEVLALYRWHGNQISTDQYRQVMDAWQVRRDFVVDNPQRVAHLSTERLHALTDRFVLQMAYRAYWSRDVLTAQKLLRKAFRHRLWSLKDLKYVLPSLLPKPVFQYLVSTADRMRSGPVE